LQLDQLIQLSTIMAPITLFVSCPGAKSEQDVIETLNSTYSGNFSTVNEIKFMHDKAGRAIAFVTIHPSPTFRPTRMDRLLQTLQAEADNDHFRGERMIFQTKPNYIEWTIKLAKSREEMEPRAAASFRPKFR
jgi:hypothetical protein